VDEITMDLRRVTGRANVVEKVLPIRKNLRAGSELMKKCASRLILVAGKYDLEW
jgi:hypothetical protein